MRGDESKGREKGERKTKQGKMFGFGRIAKVLPKQYTNPKASRDVGCDRQGPSLRRVAAPPPTAPIKKTTDETWVVLGGASRGCYQVADSDKPANATTDAQFWQAPGSALHGLGTELRLIALTGALRPLAPF